MSWATVMKKSETQKCNWNLPLNAIIMKKQIKTNRQRKLSLTVHQKQSISANVMTSVAS